MLAALHSLAAAAARTPAPAHPAPKSAWQQGAASLQHTWQALVAFVASETRHVGVVALGCCLLAAAGAFGVRRHFGKAILAFLVAIGLLGWEWLTILALLAALQAILVGLIWGS